MGARNSQGLSLEGGLPPASEAVDGVLPRSHPTYRVGAAGSGNRSDSASQPAIPHPLFHFRHHRWCTLPAMRPEMNLRNTVR
jgi:hypothetical protein